MIEGFDSLSLGLTFKDKEGNLMPEDFNLLDEARPIYNGNTWMPGFYVEGYFRVINNYMERDFYICPGGPTRILITKVPKPFWDNIEFFRYQHVNWMSAWTDGNQLWIFQVIPAWEKYFGLIKSNRFDIKKYVQDIPYVTLKNQYSYA